MRDLKTNIWKCGQKYQIDTRLIAPNRIANSLQQKNQLIGAVNGLRNEVALFRTDLARKDAIIEIQMYICNHQHTVACCLATRTAGAATRVGSVRWPVRSDVQSVL